MTDPSGDPSLHARTIARARIAKARAATIAIDQDLWSPIERLQRAGESANGAGIYADVPRFRSALHEAAAAIARAQKIIRETDWPSDHDYDIG
jgi:hypothetical protein